MRAVQIVFDEELLARLDATEEVKKHGRSEVLRRAAAEYLGRLRRKKIAAQYERAHGDGKGSSLEFEGWEEEGTWPDE